MLTRVSEGWKLTDIVEKNDTKLEKSGSWYPEWGGEKRIGEEILLSEAHETMDHAEDGLVLVMKR